MKLWTRMKLEVVLIQTQALGFWRCSKFVGLGWCASGRRRLTHKLTARLTTTFVRAEELPHCNGQKSRVNYTCHTLFSCLPYP